MNYYLMNKDNKLMKFKTMQKLGSTSVSEIITYNKLPIGFIDIATWIDNRNYAKHKDHLIKWLKDWGMDTIDGFLEITHALGINDTLWVKEESSPLHWSDVSLYQNQFDDITSKTAFEQGLFGLQLSTTSPEFTVEGTAPKFWKKEIDSIFLYKGGFSGAANVGLEPYHEYIASQICRQFSESAIFYNLVKENGRIMSKCKLFTDEKTGYIPFYKLIDVKRTHTINDVLNICQTYGFAQECKEMFLIDSFVFNQDRHLGNFGFLFNNDTFEITGFSPLFDYNSAMLCNAMKNDLTDYKTYESEYMVEHKLGGTFEDVGKALCQETVMEFPKIVFPYHERYNMQDDRMQLLQDVFEDNYNRIAKGRISSYLTSLDYNKESSMNIGIDKY